VADGGRGGAGLENFVAVLGQRTTDVAFAIDEPSWCRPCYSKRKASPLLVNE
jgi:hypothetical protein